jgi:hypothetical protein
MNTTDTNFSITYNTPIILKPSDETVLGDQITENANYSFQKASCVVYTEMGAMNESQFNAFFGTTDTRAVYMNQIKSKLENASGNELGSKILQKYNDDKGLTGIFRKERISWTVDLTTFNEALNASSVVGKFVAGNKNHFQLIFRFECDSVSYPVGMEWKMTLSSESDVNNENFGVHGNQLHVSGDNRPYTPNLGPSNDS